MWSDVITLFREYMGTGLLVIWFLLSLVYLFVREKRKPVRVLFLYVPVVLLLLYFNPFFAGIVYGKAGDEIYYRILWLLPVTLVNAFTATDIYGRLKGRAQALFAAAAVLLIMASGSFIYSNPFFHRAENRYHVPASVVDICDAIEVEGREVTAVFPAELLQYVRQYSATVCMPYGREITVEKWNHLNDLYDVMEAETIDVELLAGLAREQGCVYVVVPEDKKRTGSFAACSFEKFGQMDGYIIYKDTTISLEF